jgi:hypothetical protein
VTARHERFETLRARPARPSCVEREHDADGTLLESPHVLFVCGCDTRAGKADRGATGHVAKRSNTVFARVGRRGALAIVAWAYALRGNGTVRMSGSLSDWTESAKSSLPQNPALTSI